MQEMPRKSDEAKEQDSGRKEVKELSPPDITMLPRGEQLFDAICSSFVDWSSLDFCKHSIVRADQRAQAGIGCNHLSEKTVDKKEA